MKTVGVVSCLARGNPLHTRTFFAQNGVAVLLAVIRQGPERVSAKALYFLHCLIEQSHEHKGVLLTAATAGAVLAALQASPAASVWEHALSVLGM